MRCSEEALWLCSLFSRLEHLSLHIVSAQYICWLANQSVSWQVSLHVKKCRATSCRQLQWFSLTRWHPTPVLLPGKSHGRRSLEDCSPWGRWGSDTTERLHFPFSLSCIGEGNGNPLQCSCLENPSDAGAWWAAVYVVAQSWTRLKWLSSSKSSIKGRKSVIARRTWGRKILINFQRKKIIGFGYVWFGMKAAGAEAQRLSRPSFQ